MKKVRTLVAVCVAAGITLISANYSAADNSSIIDKDSVILAKGNGHGPGDGTGNGGSGPKDGTGNGRKKGTCTQFSLDQQYNFTIAGRGHGNGAGS